MKELFKKTSLYLCALSTCMPIISYAGNPQALSIFIDPVTKTLTEPDSLLLENKQLEKTPEQHMVTFSDIPGGGIIVTPIISSYPSMSMHIDSKGFTKTTCH